jgi:hypothetical protein
MMKSVDARLKQGNRDRDGDFGRVTGMLDLMPSRSSFIEAARRVKGPMLMIYGAGTPRRSKAEVMARPWLYRTSDPSSCPPSSSVSTRNLPTQLPKR